jgi:hypothetical protein
VLRRALLTVGVLSLLAGEVALRVGAGDVARWMFVQGAVLILGILLERWRYTPPASTDDTKWLPTGERFLDPSTDKLMEVYFNPKTGERYYRVVHELE